MLYDRFFYRLLAGGFASQHRFYGGAVHRKFSVRRNPFLPGERPRLLKEIFRCFCFEFSHFDKYPVCAAQKKIRAHNPPLVGEISNLSVFRLENLIPQILYLTPYDSLQSKSRRSDQFYPGQIFPPDYSPNTILASAFPTPLFSFVSVT